MSNDTQHSRNQGDHQRRRRNRGGRNRRGNNHGGDNSKHTPHSQNNQHNQQPREFIPGRDARGQGQGRNRSQGGRRPMPPPAKVTWWRKLLGFFGIGKPAAPPTRPARERTPDTARQAPKSNVRNLRSNDDGGGAPATDAPRQKVEAARNRGEQRGGKRNERRGGDAGTVESPRVYVGNLSYDVSESDLIDLFKGIGSVRNVEIVYNRATHRSKGYGFVEMLHVDEAKQAVEVLHDQFFMGRQMTVSGAKSKGQDEREDREDEPRRERRPRERAPQAADGEPAAAAAAVVSAEAFGDVGEIPTIVETAVVETEGEPAPSVAEAVEAAEAAPEENRPV